MKTFLRVAAVLVAWGNAYLPAIVFPTVAGNPAGLTEFVRSLGWSEALQSLFFGVVLGAVAGLLTAEVVFRLMRSLLEGGFLARYGAMVAAVCFGGLLYGAIQMFVYGSLLSGSSNLYDIVPGVVERVIGGLGLGFFGAVVGGMIGLVEGLILGFPLAAILGLFRTSH
jgi:hypothetical protein